MTHPRRRGAAAVAAGALLLASYVGLSFLDSPRGFLGTDTGGKVATLEVMTERGGFDPDLGYWASEWDPDGALHPIGFTSHTSSDKWVNVTTLPALWVGWVLYGLGGYRAALLVPMAGSVAAAFAGLALLRRLGVGDRWAWYGFWLLGLASPLTIYALDFWEHSLGVALMAWAVVLLVDVVAGFSGRLPAGFVRWRAGLAGLLFGAAATMRTEALVYLAVAGAATCGTLLFRARFGASSTPKRARNRRISAAAGVGAVLLAGALLPLLANEALERRVVGSTVRATRVAGTAASIADAPASRVEEAAMTLVGLEGNAAGILLGAAFTALLVFAAARSGSDGGIAAAAVAGAGGLLVVRVASGGFGFVPGLAPAWVLAAPGLVALAGAATGRRPFGRDSAEMSAISRPNPLRDAGASTPPTSEPTRAGAGRRRFGCDDTGMTVSTRPQPPAGPETARSRPDASAAEHPDKRLLALVAAGAIPLVLAAQYRGGAAPQWAGRYLLVSGFLLSGLGWAALARQPQPRRVAGAFAALAGAVTIAGLAWTSVRTHDVARAVAALDRRPEPVIVSGVYHLAREGGATYGAKRWLTMTPTAGPSHVVRVLDGAGIDSFASVQQVGERPLRYDGFRATRRTTERLFRGVDLEVTSWQRDP